MKFLSIILASILLTSLVGLSNFDFAFGQTDTGTLILDSFPSSGQVGDLITFSGTLKLDNKNSEKNIVYIKNVDATGKHNLLTMAYVANDGKFSARWTVTKLDSNNYLKIYASFEGNGKLSRLTTCFQDQTEPVESRCLFTRSFRVIDGPPSTSSIPENFSGDEYIGLYYTLDFYKQPLVAIVPSPEYYNDVRTHISSVQEGIYMIENLMTEKYGGNWKIKIEVIEPGENYNEIEPDVVVKLVSNDEREECNEGVNGRAWPSTQKPILAVVCANDLFGEKPVTSVMRTTAHEFLHAIGIDHAVNKDGDMMCSVENGQPTCADTTPRSQKPTPLNLATIAELYGTDGFKGKNNVVEYGSKFSGELNWSADNPNFTYDRDRDGIYDFYDLCPSIPEDYNGYIDWDGCPDETVYTSDADHDGIPNEFDRCPTAAEIYNEFQDEDGCPDYVKPSVDESKKDESTKSEQIETIIIPDWIRTQTKWWAVGSISDTVFTTKLVIYMINENMVHLESPIPDGKSIYFGGNAPNKFKANAEGWADREITNTEFLEKIQILIDFNVLRVR